MRANPLFSQIVFLTFLVFSAHPLAGDNEPKEVVIKEACPGEGCSFGEWQIKKPMPIYPQPNERGAPLATLGAGETVEAVTGEIHMIAGLARVIGMPGRGGEHIDPSQPLEILDYIGEGYSRTRQGGTYFNVKVARSMKDCGPSPDPRRCWVELIREPGEGKWWISVKARHGELKGWILPPYDSISTGTDVG